MLSAALDLASRATIAGGSTPDRLSATMSVLDANQGCLMTDVSTFSSRSLQIYFNSARAHVDGRLTERLVSFIGGTDSTLDVAIYDLTDPSVLDALAKVARARGKTLRIAFDASGERPTNAVADPKPGKTHQAIIDAGLDKLAKPVYLTGRHLMHDKFLIRDGKALWTGSANFTHGGLALQDNACLELASAPLAKLYQPVFEDLLRDPAALAAPLPAKPVKVGGAQISVYFAPAAGEGIDELVTRLLKAATKVRLMAFVITDPDILTALARFAPARADIQGIVDPAAVTTAKKIKTLDPSVLWWIKDKRIRLARSHPFTATGDNDFQHNKLLIIDDHLVVGGSYNLSENAEANDENLLLIDSPNIATAYSAYFDAVYATGKPNA
jgi:phosphatidylserine/phosphatidylglycerophosphate/cardiolipin synthase-like enzyme